MRRSSCVSGLCTPGVSTNTTCAAGCPGSPLPFFFNGTSSTPWIRVRVVCGLCVTIASFCPRRAFSNVDLPAFGRPTIDTKPERKAIPFIMRCQPRRDRIVSAKLAHMNLVAPRTPRKLALLLALSAPLSLAAEAPARFHSTEIHADRSVTFFYKDAAATKVTLALDGVAKPIPMEKDATGVWTVTTQPLTPEIYSYHFEADGDRRFDPTNPRTTINLV